MMLKTLSRCLKLKLIYGVGQSKRDLDLESHEGRTKGSGRGTGAEHVKTLRFYAPQSGTMSQSEPSYLIDKSRDPIREFVKLGRVPDVFPRECQEQKITSFRGIAKP